jgi:hypothetical protein
MGFFSTSSRPPQRDDKSWLGVSLRRIKDIHSQAPLVVVSVGSIVGTLGIGFAYRRYIRRIPNAQFVSANAIAKKRWIKGVVTKYLVPVRKREAPDLLWFLVFETPITSGCIILQA